MSKAMIKCLIASLFACLCVAHIFYHKGYSSGVVLGYNKGAGIMAHDIMRHIEITKDKASKGVDQESIVIVHRCLEGLRDRLKESWIDRYGHMFETEYRDPSLSPDTPSDTTTPSQPPEPTQ